MIFVCGVLRFFWLGVIFTFVLINCFLVCVFWVIVDAHGASFGLTMVYFVFGLLEDKSEFVIYDLISLGLEEPLKIYSLALTA